MNHRFCSLLLAISFTVWCGRADAQIGYDPLKIDQSQSVTEVDLTLKDDQRQREIPIRVYLLGEAKKSPLVLFSHGLGGSRENNSFLGKHLSLRGYVVVFVQHPGSDESVWRETRLAERLSSMKQAASGENLILRGGDIRFVIDSLTKLNEDRESKVYQRLDIDHVGMSGHSFGAHTTQLVSGQRLPVLGTKYSDSRIDAGVCYSPAAPARGDVDRAFDSVRIPLMLMTGTEDKSPINDTSVESRLAVYPALPDSIDKYEIVMWGAAHSAFSERVLRMERAERNPNHHRIMLAYTTAFWDSYLREDPAAKEWLSGDGAKQMLEPKDRWQVHLSSGIGQ